MDLMVKISYNEILNLVKQLPASKLKQLQATINQDFVSKKAIEEISELQNFLLNAPIMSDDELVNYNENRKSFEQWRAKN